ncbi:DNA/RNA non-specific endonuclease [Flavobacterium sp.]
MKYYIFKKYFSVLFLLFLISCKKEALTFNTEVKFASSLVKNVDLTPISTTNQIIYHTNYSLSYVEKQEQAEWVAYWLLKKNFKINRFRRPFFIQDNKVETRSADWRNYKNSGYDKGHLCPAGDMTFSLKAYQDTFLTSNIAPQQHNFNAGIWNRLEQKIRYWVEKKGNIYVVSGGVLNSKLKTIGYEKVAVPEYFYKIIACWHEGTFQVLAFLVPHADSNKPLYSFVTSVDEIERLTGIDFFSRIEDSIEKRVEKSKDYKDWSFN